MKRILLFLLAQVMLLTSCGLDERSMTLKQNEERIEAVLAMLAPIADDLCSAWELVESGGDMTVEVLSEAVNLSVDELTEGIIYVYTSLSGAAQETVAEAQRTYLKGQINTCLALHSSELVWIVSSSYKKAGAFDPIEEYLKETEASVKGMERQDARLSERLEDCRELFRLCSQPSDNYESGISRIRELIGA